MQNAHSAVLPATLCSRQNAPRRRGYTQWHLRDARTLYNNKTWQPRGMSHHAQKIPANRQKILLTSALSVSDKLRLVDTYLQTGLDALSDSTRLAIFQKLAKGPMAVHELAETFPVSRPAVSQHLRVLKDAGLVSDSKRGTSRVYRVNPEGIALLRAHFDQLWDQALSAFEISVESTTQKSVELITNGEKHATDRRRNRRT
jgi:DNA-binding transcriptional ArsR family regulator